MKIPKVKIQVKIENLTEATKLTSSSDVYKELHGLYDQDSVYYPEESIIIFMNRSNKVLGYKKISSGGVTGTVVDARIIFTHALMVPGCVSVIVSHNHPSGQVNPSKEDIKLTDKLKKAGDIIDIKITDHIVYTPEKYFSFSDEGLI